MYLNAKHDKLVKLYAAYVKHPDGHWKGRAECIVPIDIVDDVAEAMDYHGSVVDFRRTTSSGQAVVLISKGYWHHIG